VTEKPKKPDLTYIGDGVYASFDGWHIWLHTQRDMGVDKIALDAAVFYNLIAYAKRVWPRRPEDDTRQHGYGAD
jgi:hypothetical protein